MKRLFFSFFVFLLCAINFVSYGQTTSTFDFNTVGDLTRYFNQGGTTTNVTESATGGINNSRRISVTETSTNEVFVTKQGYVNGGVGSVYEFTTYFKSVWNSGYGGVGFTTDANATHSNYAYPTNSIGISVHGGGYIFNSGNTISSGSWSSSISDLLNSGSPDDWYKVVFTVTQGASNVFDLVVKVYPANSDGSLIRSTPDATQTAQFTNATMASAPVIYSYFAFGGSRIQSFDNYSINLEGSTIVEAGFPIVTGSATLAGTTITMNGNVTSDRGSAVTERGFVYSATNAEPTVSDTKVAVGTGTGTFTSNLTSVSGNYYIRSYATNSAGTSYSSLSSFISSKTFLENTVNTTPQLLFPSNEYSYTTATTNFLSKYIDVNYNSGGSTQDVLYIEEEGTGTGELNILRGSTNSVRIGSTAIGTFASSLGGSGVNGESLRITWNSNATLAYIKKVINSLTYQNNSNTPSATRVIRLFIEDGSNDITKLLTVNVTAENDIHVIGSTVTEVADITTPGDPVDFMFGRSPGSEQVQNAIDNNTNTKYLNFSGVNTGFTVTPSIGSTKVNQLKFTTANDESGRDPLKFNLYGSNDDGVTYTPIALGVATNLTTTRFTEASSPVFVNDKGFSKYKLTFPQLRSSGSIMQIGEVEFLGIPFQQVVFAMGASPQSVHPNLPIFDAENDQIASARVTINSGLDANDVLSWTSISGISGVYDSSTGTLDFSGTASIADYRTLLRSVKFTTTSNSNGKERDVIYRVTDTNGNNSGTTSSVVIVTFQPQLTGLDSYGSTIVSTATPITYSGVVSKTIGLNDNDPEDNPLDFIVTSLGSNGTLVLNGSAVSVGTIITSGDTLTWTPSSTGTNVKVLGLKAFDGDLSSSTEVNLNMDVVAPSPPVISSFSP